jgi:putative ATP-binding cassette transporter
LTLIIGLNLGLVGVNVLQNEANGALFTALQQQNAPGFYHASVVVILLILLYLAVAVLRVYLDQTLQLRWRRWLTDQYVTRWLADRAFYRMRFAGRVDNPDQRISEDVRLFIERSMSLGLGFLNSWRRSPPLPRYFGISPVASRCRSAVSRSRSRATCSGWPCFTRGSDR